jgi:hypothetical protein
MAAQEDIDRLRKHPGGAELECYESHCGGHIHVVYL